MHLHAQRILRKSLLHNATSVPHCTCYTLLRSSRGYTRNGPTLAALQTGYGFGTFQMARSLILTSVNAQCTQKSFSTPATRQRHRCCTSECQRRVRSPLRYADDPVITSSKYLCRSSCLRMYLVLVSRFSVQLAIRITMMDSFCLEGRNFDMNVLAVRHTATTAANVSPSHEDLERC